MIKCFCARKKEDKQKTDNEVKTDKDYLDFMPFIENNSNRHIECE